MPFSFVPELLYFTCHSFIVNLIKVTKKNVTTHICSTLSTYMNVFFVPVFFFFYHAVPWIPPRSAFFVLQLSWFCSYLETLYGRKYHSWYWTLSFQFIVFFVSYLLNFTCHCLVLNLKKGIEINISNFYTALHFLFSVLFFSEWFSFTFQSSSVLVLFANSIIFICKSNTDKVWGKSPYFNVLYFARH